MKLSEAISLGATMHPQAYNSYRKTSHVVLMNQAITITTATCALAAAAVAIGRLEQVLDEHNMDTLFLAFPELVGCQAWCPECGIQHRLTELIIHLNDNHRWTRERIASLMRQMEQERGKVADDVVINEREEEFACV